MRFLFVLLLHLMLGSIASAQEFEFFMGDGPASLPKPKPVNYFAKCLANDAMACEIFKSQSSEGGLEAGDIERAEYVACDKKGRRLSGAGDA